MTTAVPAGVNTKITKKKLNKADYMFKSKNNEELIKMPGDIDGIDFMLRDLHGCTVYLFDWTAQIQLDKCTDTTFYIGPIKGSIFMRDCKDCTITVACSQFRCRDVYNTTVNLFVGNNPCIESSENVFFAPYNLAYPLLNQHCASAGLRVAENHWDLIHDFTEKDTGEANYAIVDPGEWEVEAFPLEGIDEQPAEAIPYPVRYGGTIPDDAYFGEAEDPDAYNIKNTSQRAAEQAFAQRQAQEQARMQQNQQAQNL